MTVFGSRAYIGLCFLAACFWQHVKVSLIPAEDGNIGRAGLLDAELVEHTGENNLPDVVPALRPEEGLVQPILDLNASS